MMYRISVISPDTVSIGLSMICWVIESDGVENFLLLNGFGSRSIRSKFGPLTGLFLPSCCSVSYILVAFISKADILALD